jgi:diamine N-acetyltransferase
MIDQYVLNAYKDIYEVKQLRLIIETNKGIPLGMIDLFDFDFKNKRAGVGVVIKNTEDRQKGYGKEALLLLVKYSFNRLDLHQLYCNILEDNIPSIKLFENVGFKRVGLKKDWNYSDGKFKNEFLLQLIKTDVH